MAQDINKVANSDALNEDDFVLISKAGALLRRLPGSALADFIKKYTAESSEAEDQPTVTTIDASLWDSGTLSVSYDDGTTDNLPVVFDANGVPTSVGGVTLIFPEVE